MREVGWSPAVKYEGFGRAIPDLNGILLFTHTDPESVWGVCVCACGYIGVSG